MHAVHLMAPEIEITTVVREGLSSAADGEILEYTWLYRWLLISHDVNTMKLFAEQRIANGQEVHGLFLVPQNRTTRSIAESLVLIWSASEFEEWRNRIVYLPF